LLEGVFPARFYQHILDFGAGWGRFTKFLESRGSHVWAVDIVPQWLTSVQRLSKTLTAVTLDSPALPLDSKSMDLIVDLMTLQSIDDDRLFGQFIAELRRVAAPGGNILSLHKLADGIRSSRSIVQALGIEDNWEVVMSTDVDVAGDVYCLLLGRKGRR
jgi:ubiquinone/menaquinone biosynthesis C-methylase UbiE